MSASRPGPIPWWRGEDSNLRRHSQQIYSLPRLTASVPLPASRRAAQQKSVTTPLALASPDATAVARTVRGVRIAVINCPARGTRSRAQPPSLCFLSPIQLLGLPPRQISRPCDSSPPNPLAAPLNRFSPTSRILGAGDGTRTRNLLITNQLLYRLSYASVHLDRSIAVGL